LAIDRIDWHSGADNFPSELNLKAGGTHIGMYLAWIIHHNLVGELHITESQESIAKVKNRTMTGTEFLICECDEKFWEADLNAEGLAFTQLYYENTYYDDYSKALGANHPSLYHVPDTWENYDIISKHITSAYARWQKN
jgi:hypothetical protein